MTKLNSPVLLVNDDDVVRVEVNCLEAHDNVELFIVIAWKDVELAIPNVKLALPVDEEGWTIGFGLEFVDLKQIVADCLFLLIREHVELAIEVDDAPNVANVILVVDVHFSFPTDVYKEHVVASGDNGYVLGVVEYRVHWLGVE